MNLSQMKWPAVVVVILLVVVAGMAITIKLQSSKNTLLQQSNTTLEGERNEAKAIFSNYQAATVLFNNIAEAAHNEQQQAKRESETRIVYIRQALKADTCAIQPVPDAAVEQLRQHANKVRSN